MDKTHTINLSNNTSFEGVLIVDHCNHSERSGFWRAFWANLDTDGTIKSQVTVEGYCSGLSYPTRRQAAYRAEKLHPGFKARTITPSGRPGSIIIKPQGVPA